MKRVLVIVNDQIAIYKFKKELLVELIKQGYEVYICLPYGEFVDEMVEMGCKFVDTTIDRRGTNPIKDFNLLCSYVDIIKKINPNIVITLTIKPNVYGGMACRLTKTKYIATITGVGTAVENKGWLSNISLFLYKLAFKKANAVFFQNTANCDFFRQKKIVSDNVIMVPGSGVNLQQHKIEEYPEDDGTIKFIFIGRIMKNKGIDELIECAVRIRKKYENVYFDLIGMIEEEEYLEKLEELSRKGILRYYGQQKDVHGFIKLHHATVLPSYHEGIANVLLESAATGRPVLASNIPGCKETLENGKTGYIFEVRDVDSMYDAVERFIELPYSDKAQMGINGRKKMENEFNRNIVTDAYMEQVNKLC